MNNGQDFIAPRGAGNARWSSDAQHESSRTLLCGTERESGYMLAQWMFAPEQQMSAAGLSLPGWLGRTVSGLRQRLATGSPQ